MTKKELCQDCKKKSIAFIVRQTKLGERRYVCEDCKEKKYSGWLIVSY